jgi:preprotein translocase subunit SecE
MAKKSSNKSKKAKKNTAVSPAAGAGERTLVPGESEADAVEAEAEAREEIEKKAEKAAKSSSPKDHKKNVSKSASKAPKKEGIFRKFLNYIHNVQLEIKRTTWPTRDEVLRMSLIVVGALIFFGVFIFVIDWVMTQLVDLYAGFAGTGADTSGLSTDTGTIDTSATDTGVTDTGTTDTSATDVTTDTGTDTSATDTTTTDGAATEDSTGEAE